MLLGSEIETYGHDGASSGSRESFRALSGNCAPRPTIAGWFVFLIFALLVLTVPSTSLAQTTGPTSEVELEIHELSAQFIDLERSGRIDEALVAAKITVARSQELLGAEHPVTLDTKSKLAAIYDALSQISEAEASYVEILQTARRVFGPDHPITLGHLSNLAIFYRGIFHSQEAISLQREALEARLRILGPEHPDTLESLHEMALTYQFFLRRDLAEESFLQALEARRRVLGHEHPDTLSTLAGLARVLLDTQQFSEAEAYAIEALHARRKVLGLQDIETLESQHDLGVIYLRSWRFFDAEAQLRRVAAARRKILGHEHRDTRTSIAGLAQVHSYLMMSSSAVKLYKEVLDNNTVFLGEEHPQSLRAMTNLAAAYMDLAKYQQAQPLLIEATSVADRSLGPEDPLSLNIKASLSQLYMKTENFDEAERLLQEIIDLHEVNDDFDVTFEIEARLALAAFYGDRGWYLRAEKIILEEINNWRKITGSEAAFEPYLHGLLLEVYNRAGRLTEATALLENGLRHHRQSWDPNDSMSTVMSILFARHLLTLGRTIDAVVLLRESVIASRHQADREADAASEASLRLVALERMGSSDAFALALAGHAPMAETADLAALVVLNRKGLVGEREAALLRLARTAEAEEVRRIAADLLVARRDLAAAYRRLSRIDGGDAAEQAFQTATERVDGLERDLALADPTYRAPRDVTAEEVAAALPVGTVLIDYTLFTSYDFEARNWDGGQHVGAVVLRPGAEAVFVDLGPLAAMQPAIDSLSATLGGGDGDTGWTAGIELHKALLRPLAQYIAGAETLFISPAGPLGLIPFDMLRTSPSDKSTLAASGPTLRLLSTGRALVAEALGEAGQGLVAFGGVDYEQASGTAATRVQTEQTLLALVEQARGATAEATIRAGGLQSFAPLPQTAVEINAIAEIWRAAGGEASALHIGAGAQEAQLTALTEAPRVLHLATHGFVEETEAVGARAALLTGIALAGANQAGETEDGGDGVLFGYEIEALDLAGTELVVVSACETGRGRADATEGIYSLARGFRLAGAGAVLVTLKQVDDALTAAFMADFYQAWLGTPGTTPAEALARTKRAWAQSPNPRHSRPDTWAAFVLVENRM